MRRQEAHRAPERRCSLYSLRGTPVLENGILKSIIGTAMDVNEQEQMTLELQRREAYLAAAQRLSHNGSFGWRPSTREIFSTAPLFSSA
jgi:hypothetical protein